MDKTKIRELFEFAKDENRVNAAFDNVIAGVSSGRIRSDEFTLAAAPLRVGNLKDDREFVARFLEQTVGIPLSDEQKNALDETIIGLPEQAGLNDLFQALESVESLAPFVTALNNFLDKSVKAQP